MGRTKNAANQVNIGKNSTSVENFRPKLLIFYSAENFWLVKFGHFHIAMKILDAVSASTSCLTLENEVT